MTDERIAIHLTSMELGGAQRVALNLATGLIERGYDVDLVLVDARGELLRELPDTVTVVDLDASRVANSLFPLRQYISQREPDTVYSMLTETNVITILAHSLARSDSRLVISEHNMMSDSVTNRKDAFILKLAGITYPRADHVVAVSEGVREDVLDVVGLNESGVTRIYNPVDIDRIQTHAAEPVNHPWLDGDYDVVISAGRHVPQKGFDTLIRAFARLDGNNARLILLGKGDQTDALRQVAVEEGVDATVDFLGFVDNPFAYIARANTFVLSSKHEGFGMVLVEAMACGCPVVSTDCPSGPAEILDDGAFGPLVPVGSIREMADAIEYVLDFPTDTDKLRQRASTFSIQRITTEYEPVLCGD